MTIEGLKYIIYHSEGTEVEWRSQGWPLGDNSILNLSNTHRSIHLSSCNVLPIG